MVGHQLQRASFEHDAFGNWHRHNLVVLLFAFGEIGCLAGRDGTEQQSHHSQSLENGTHANTRNRFHGPTRFTKPSPLKSAPGRRAN